MDCHRFSPDPGIGLSSKQVEERKRAGLVEGDAPVYTKSFGAIVRNNLCTLFNLINLILGLSIFLVGAYKNLLFLGVIICNIIIGTVQEIRAKITIDRMSILSASKATVVRDGKTANIPLCEIVLDDVLCLATGNQVLCDCVLLSGECEVNESLLTGESDPVSKKPGDLLLSGSFIISGQCRTKVEHLGEDNFASRLCKQAKYLKKSSSEILRSIKKIIKVISVVIFPIGLILFYRQYTITGNTLESAVVHTCAALIGMIPEGLVLLTSTVLAVGVIKLSRRQVLVQDLYCIETLARVDVLCLDKTGTITEGKMKLLDVLPLNGWKQNDVGEALNAFMRATTDQNPTAKAIRAKYNEEPGWKPGRVIPFSSDRKWSGISFEGKGSYILGAPEMILNRPGPVLAEKIKNCEDKGRVLLLAKSDEPFEGTTLPLTICPVALLLLEDVLRNNATETLAYFKLQGVDLKVISGDSARTVSGIAKRVGLPQADKYIDVSTLKTDEELEQAVNTHSVFGRVTPAEKKKMVCFLQKAGHTVAMTGDGVNDVLALKEADCSIAMASGSDAARSVSQLVLLNSSFDSLPKIVAEGRQSINNLERSASLFLVKTIYSFILALLFLFVQSPYPFKPIQMTLISAFSIGIPSFFLALEPNIRRIRGNFLFNIMSRAVPGALTIITNIIVVTAISILFHIPYAQSSTICVLLAGFTGLMLVFKLCLPFNLLRLILFGFCTAGVTIGVLFFRDLFSIALPSAPALILFLILVAVSVILFNGLTFIFYRFFEKNTEKQKKPL